MRDTFYFTSESVSKGHPDKICDQISDAILDECLRQDFNSHVACETFTTTGMVLVGGELKTKAIIDINTIVRNVLKDIGYTNPSFGIDADSCSVINALHQQSEDIDKGIQQKKDDLGAGDQGLMFGYANTDNNELMPMPIHLAHDIMKSTHDYIKNTSDTCLGPDGKCQVTVKYKNGRPVKVDKLVFSQQHLDKIGIGYIHEELKKIIKLSEVSDYIDESTEILLNPSGRFVVGGPTGDAGLTGRKIIVDTYGGYAPHGGGAFSGKDPTKVDRSAAYMARYISKNIVEAGLAEECLVQLSYAIGVSEPTSLYVNTKDTGIMEDERIERIIRKVFPLTPTKIIDSLNLQKPIYSNTAAFGHFGNGDYPWEQTNKVNDILRELT